MAESKVKVCDPAPILVVNPSLATVAFWFSAPSPLVSLVVTEVMRPCSGAADEPQLVPTRLPAFSAVVLPSAVSMSAARPR